MVVQPSTNEIRDFSHTISPRISLRVCARVTLPYLLHRVVVRTEDKGHEKTLYVPQSHMNASHLLYLSLLEWECLKLNTSRKITFWRRLWSCFVSKALNLVAKGAEALRTDQFGGKVKLSAAR